MNSKALFVTPYYYPNIIGGAEISTQLIAEGNPKKAVVLTAGTTTEEEYINGVQVIRISNKTLSIAWDKAFRQEPLTISEKIKANIFSAIAVKSLVKKYVAIMKKNDIKTVVINSNAEALGRASIWKASKAAGARTILVLRDPILLDKKIVNIDIGSFYRRNIIRQMKWIDEIAAPSRYMIDLYESKGIKKDKSTTIPNAVKCEYFEPLYTNEKTIVYAGSIRKEKGIETLLKAIVELKTYRLDLYGQGPLEAQCREAGNNVTVHEWIKQDELYRKIREAKIIVLPAEYPEAFGRIIIEAVACGTLVIGSDAGGIPEVLGFDERYIYPAGNVEQLKEKIIRINNLSESEYCHEVSELQNKFQKYSFSVYTDNWWQYLDMCER